MNIPMSKPSVGSAELKLLANVFKTGWLGEGNYTEEFEKKIAEITGAPHVVAVNTGTSALHLALHALGVSERDEVILPSMTFVSDPMAVIMCGAKPVFCDIDKDTLTIDHSKIAELVTPQTKVIMPTDFANMPSNIKAIKAAAGKGNIKIVRDACHLFGSTDSEGKPLGVSSGEDITCFSFDPIKNLTCGEGGAILFKDGSLEEKLRSQKMLGIVRSSWYSFSKKKMEDRRVIQHGFRYHMSNINAAIGLAQLKRFNTLAKKRQMLAKRYDELLARNRNVSLFERNYTNIVPFMYVIRVAAETRDDLIRYLVERGVHAGLRYFPCHLQPFFSEYSKTRLPVTEQVAQEILSLPLYRDLTIKQVKYIVSLIKSFFD